jgi:hypothetical protein
MSTAHDHRCMCEDSQPVPDSALFTLAWKPPSVTCAFGCASFSAADKTDVAVFAANCWRVGSITGREGVRECDGRDGLGGRVLMRGSGTLRHRALFTT